MKRMLQLPCRLVLCQMSSFSLKAKFGVGLGSIGLQRNIHHTMDSNPGLKPPPSPPLHGKEVKEIQIPVPWGHISGKWWGSTDIQPLLGLHGWQDNAGTWDRLAPLLPPNISLLAVDFPGHGLSSHFHPGRAYHFIEYVSFVRRIMTFYGWEKVSFLSHSMGSITSFVYSCVYPELVENYVGIDAMKPYSYNPVKGIRKGGKVIDAFIDISRWDPATAPSYTYEEARDRLCKATKGSVTPEHSHYLLARGLTKMADGRYRYSRDSRLKSPQLMNWTHATILDLASNINCNVCNISANPGLTYDKKEKHQDVYDVVQKSAKSFENHVVEGTHHVHLIDPNAVLPIILNFLKKHTKK